MRPAAHPHGKCASRVCRLDIARPSKICLLSSTHEHDHHDHHHDHDHSELSETELRVRALETILTEKGYVDPAALDAMIETYETKIGPRNGARVVAKAWADPGFQARLLEDATKAIARSAMSGRQGEHIVASRTRRSRTTWSCARCAPAIPGRCSGCRRSGTNRRPIARAR
jgi:hypothetical protein